MPDPTTISRRTGLQHLAGAFALLLAPAARANNNALRYQDVRTVHVLTRTGTKITPERSKNYELTIWRVDELDRTEKAIQAKHEPRIPKGKTAQESRALEDAYFEKHAKELMAEIEPAAKRHEAMSAFMRKHRLVGVPAIVVNEEVVFYDRTDVEQVLIDYQVQRRR